ncbi:MAG: Lrp/AsnC family transcriptional regulator [Candidatus Thermoplasmatota archaeon]|nr:Lrp/AsnC family transcriptional regulator [Candidatus Thermoplasmatota archaeon]
MVGKTDREIILLIQKDARTPITEIARQVGLSENGVRYRLEKMEKAGYITGYTALLNPGKFGKKIRAVLSINTSPRKTKHVISRLMDMEELDTIYQTTGNYTILATGLFEDMDVLNTFVSSKLSHEGILDFSVEIVTKKHKDSPFIL